MRNVRSLLSTPGHRPRMLESALSSEADAIVVDLEDSVPPEFKPAARRAMRALLEDAPEDAPLLYARVNHDAVATDVQAIVAPRLAGVQLPKAESPEAVQRLDELLGDAEAAAGVAPGTVEIIVSIESALAVLRAFELLSASPRVVSVMPAVAENGDLHADLGYVHTRDEIATLHVRSHVLLAARAAKLPNPIDGIYSGVRDLDGFIASAKLARTLGYRGKKLSHPSQIGPTNEIFAPTDDELDFHRRVLRALEEAEAQGLGATTVDGLMVDIAMGEMARRVLAQAR
ncbi:CoA ester lyase [Solirubrobacter ginsenosidimutans]|uniref:CoA ester lyase n=1 Tax=Solirubrobacter ginsenosidimutans TaxID=490573 RepID=A0A9X3MP35_9ACTN|nr:CoA ester lyase [Solirubrobacter ginsenosidimutans]MDA0159247.1 CoA ester lyase [Solirubrobacter ginsenosidimutans]